MARSPATPKTTTRTPKTVDTPATPDSNDTSPASPAATPFDRDQAIREAAFASFEARGCEPGHELDDWLKAEALVQQTHGEAGA